MKQFTGEMKRIPERGKIAGVCAGVAEYFCLEVWLVRIVMVAGVLLSGPFFIFLYIAAWFILDKKGDSETVIVRKAEHLATKVEIKTKVWQAGEPPRQAMKDIRGQFDKIEDRLRAMESYVTSPQYQLKKEIDKL